MAKFTIAGSTYEAKSTVEAWQLHQKAQTARSTLATGTAAKTTAAKPNVVQPKPVAKAPSTVVKQPISTPSQIKKPDAVAAPAQTKTAAVVNSGPPKPFEMVCYRGEKSQWWRPPHERLVCGMTVYDPWNVQCKNMTELWERLRDEINRPVIGNGNIPAFAQYLRAQGRPFAVATARTLDGAFTYEHNYVMKIPNARTFLWGPKVTLGAEVNFTNADGITADYIVLNASTIAESTLLAFGHKCGTYEVTFVHDLPLKYIDQYNKKSLSELQKPIKKESELGFQDKIDLRRYLRRTQGWLG